MPSTSSFPSWSSSIRLDSHSRWVPCTMSWHPCLPPTFLPMSSAIKLMAPFLSTTVMPPKKAVKVQKDRWKGMLRPDAVEQEVQAQMQKPMLSPNTSGSAGRKRSKSKHQCKRERPDRDQIPQEVDQRERSLSMNRHQPPTPKGSARASEVRGK